MVDCVFSLVRHSEILIVGGRLRYGGEERIKRMVFARGGDERRQTEEALTFILETMKRPCRIARRTDLFWLYREQRESQGDIRLATAMARHQIAGTMVPPASALIEEVRCALGEGPELLGGAWEIFGEGALDENLGKEPPEAIPSGRPVGESTENARVIRARCG